MQAEGKKEKIKTKTKIRIIRLSDDQLNDANGGISYLAPRKSDAKVNHITVAIPCCPGRVWKNMPGRCRKTFTKGNLIGFCQDCHIFVYEYNLSLHQGHNIICAGGR